MRISALSKQSGVPVSSIKLYLREGLLPAGEPTAANQHSYDHAHVRRLRLIQALTQVGDLTLKQMRGILGLIDEPAYPVHQLLGQTLISGIRCGYTNEQYDAAMTDVDDLIARYRWAINGASPARLAAAVVIATMRNLGHADLIGMLDRLAYHADELAYGEDPPESTEAALVTAVLGDRLLIALRRLAEENVNASETTTADKHRAVSAEGCSCGWQVDGYTAPELITWKRDRHISDENGGEVNG